MEILGIDIGGTGIKGAPVQIETGKMTGERFRIKTPKKATPQAVMGITAEIARHFQWKGPIGCGFPGVLKGGKVYTAANLGKSWIGVNAQKMLEKKTHCPVAIVNDADAAGLAEIYFGAGKDKKGLVLMLTLGTGIGSALFLNGKLVPNAELGHIELRGKDAERRAAERVRIKKDLSWKKWAKGVNEYLTTIENLLWPDLIIIGGGASKNHKEFFPYLHTRTKVVAAKLENIAGIVGAALAGIPEEKMPLRKSVEVGSN